MSSFKPIRRNMNYLLPRSITTGCFAVPEAVTRGGYSRRAAAIAQPLSINILKPPVRMRAFWCFL